MYEVYIRHWKKADGTIDTGYEVPMFSVPTDSADGFPVNNPSVKGSEDAADSFDFTMELTSPYYNSLVPMITLVRVYYGGTSEKKACIFYGRVLTISGSTVWQTRNVHCEGAMAFLNDSYYEGKPEKDRSEISWSTYFDNILNNHNGYFEDENWKKIFRGTIGFTPTSENKKFEPSSWTQSSSLLSSLKDEYGGHMNIRYGDYGYLYLDWYKYYKRDLGDGKRPVVRIGENILDISINHDVGNAFTRVIPIGKTGNNGNRVYIQGYTYSYTDPNTGATGTATHSGKDMPVALLPWLYSASELNDEYHSVSDYADADKHYGVVYKTQEFPEADTQEKLWNECKKWIKESYYGEVRSFEIKAIDMHILNTDLPIILVGDCVDVYYKIAINGVAQEQYKKLICKSAKYDLFNPDNNTYTFGVPSDLLKASKKSSSSSKKTASGAVSGGKGGGEKPDTELTFAKIAEIIRNDPDVTNGYGGEGAAESFLANGQMSGSVSCYDADVHYDPVSHPEIIFTASLVGRITITGKATKYIAFNNAHGLFAYLDSSASGDPGVDSWILTQISKNAGTAKPATHWYIKAAGYTYADEYNPTVSGMIFGTSSNIISTVTNGLKTLITPQTYISLGEQLVDGTKNLISGLINDGPTDPSFMADFANTVWTFLDPTVPDNDKAKLEIKGKYGTVDGIIAHFGANAAKHTNPNWNISLDGSGLSGILNLFNLNGGSSGGLIQKGLEFLGLGNISAWFTGSDRNKKGAELDASGILNLFNPTTDTGTDDKTIELDGQGSSGEGLISLGSYIEQEHQKWRVKLNNIVTYKDENDQEYTLPGFVSASDFNMVGSIPSFKTELAIVGTLIAGKVNAVDIEADIGYIHDLAGDVIKATRSVRAGNGYFTNTWSSNLYATGGVYFTNASAHNVDLKKCYNQCLITEKNGVITLTMYPADGSTPREGYDISTFNMAATAFYQNAVAAAWNNGGATAYFTASRTVELNPGWTSTIYAFYKNHDGLATRSTVSEDGKYSELTIKARNLRLRTPAAAVIPTTETQDILPGNDPSGTAYDGLAKVTVRGDANLIASNIKKGTSIFNVSGSFEATPEALAAARDTGWNAARSVIYNSLPNSSQSQSVPDTNWTLKIPKSGGYNSGSDDCYVTVASTAVDYSYSGATMKVLNVSVGGNIAYRKAITNLNPGYIKKDITILGVTGTYETDPTLIKNAWNNGGATAYFTSSRTADLNPGQTTTVYAYYKNYDGLATRSTVSETGKYSELTVKARSLNLRTPAAAVIPTTSNQDILPGNDPSGTAYDGLAKVTVKGDANLIASNIKKGTSIFNVSGSFEATPEALATARDGGWRACYNDIDLNYNYSPNLTPGMQISIYPMCKPSEDGAHAWIPSKGIFVTALSDNNLQPYNIKSGVVIFGVTGNYTGGGSVTGITSIGEGEKYWYQGALFKNFTLRAALSNGTNYDQLTSLNVTDIHTAASKYGFNADHSMFIAVGTSSKKSTEYTLPAGESINVWPGFCTQGGGGSADSDTNTGKQWGTPCKITAAGASHSISFAGGSGWYMTGGESDVKTAAAYAMSTLASNLTVVKNSSSPSRWCWCKVSSCAGTRYLLMGF